MYDYLQVSSRDSLFFIKNCVPNPRAVVLMCHGFTNHSGDYEEYVNLLNRANYSVYRYDMRGHGKSIGERGDIDSYVTYIRDLDTMVRMVTRENIHTPVFTIGFSMGGLVTALYGMDYPNRLSGQIFLGPAVGMVNAVRGPKRIGVRLLNALSDDMLLKFKDGSLEFNKPIHKDDLERDYFYTSRNPLKLAYFTVRFVKTIFVDGGEAVLRGQPRYWYPTFIAHGEVDPTVPVSVSQEFYDGIPSRDKELKVYPGMRHVLYDEPHGDIVMRDTIAWLNDRTTPKR